MDQTWFDYFSNRDFWEKQVQTYIKMGSIPGKSNFFLTTELWDYFKFCILTDNRFFFDHPLLQVIKRKINEHVITLPVNTTLFRARIDTDNKLQKQLTNMKEICILSELRNRKEVLNTTNIDRMISQFGGIDGYNAYQEQYKNGFEGFSAAESMCPPPHKVSHGRCNLPNSPHLYAASCIHTAIAETRPYIHDTISVVSLSCKKALKIVDFCFDWNDQDIIQDLFYICMSSEFSTVNKNNENNYFATQYLTMLVKSMGYDGLTFKSSLVTDGENYVFFDDTVCKAISSKLYTIKQARYEAIPENVGIHLRNSDGAMIPNPSFIE